MINKRYEKVRFNKGTVTYWNKCTNCDFSKYVTLSALAQYPKTRTCPVCGTLIYPMRVKGLEETNDSVTLLGYMAEYIYFSIFNYIDICNSWYHIK